jgi:protein involved in polysaccharide export with SLBB domain
MTFLPAVLSFALVTPTQAQISLGEQRRQASRAELEQMAKAAEGAAQVAPDSKTRERMINDATAIRMRLKNGDFVPGDRILIQLLGDSLATDTFTVRGDRVLQLPNLPDISLAGVLDSELKDHLTKEVGKYVKKPEINATSLLRLAMLGSIGHGGFITIPTDQAITDVLMATGGPGPTSDFNKTVVKRAGKVIVSPEEFQEAVRANRTVGDMSLRDGDEIFVPDKKQAQNYLQALQLFSALFGLYFIVRWGRRPTSATGTTP